eukprot:9228135-Pyramimonas_sp.AAC.1
MPRRRGLRRGRRREGALRRREAQEEAQELSWRPQERDDGAHAVVGDRPRDAIGLRDPLGV